MSQNVLSNFRAQRSKAPPKRPSNTLSDYLSKVVQSYLDRTQRHATGGLDMAEEGAQQFRDTLNPLGFAKMVGGPIGAVMSPITALVPDDQEINAAPYPEWAKPGVRALSQSALLALPGPDFGPAVSSAGNAARRFGDDFATTFGVEVPEGAAVYGAGPVIRKPGAGQTPGPAEGIIAYHGSPHTFDKFDMSKIGTGEGNQSFGHGLYFAQTEDGAKAYRNARPLQVEGQTMVGPRQGLRDPETEWADFIAGEKDPLKAARERLAEADTPDEAAMWQRIADKFEGGTYSKNTGSMYQVRINAKPDEFLNWDAPLSQQPAQVRSTLNDMMGRTPPVDHPGSTVYNRISEELGGARGIPNEQMAEVLKQRGIKGIRYKDAGSRGGEGGTYNYVIFDDKIIDILKRYGIPMTVGLGGAMVVSGQNMPPDIAAQIGPQG